MFYYTVPHYSTCPSAHLRSKLVVETMHVCQYRPGACSTCFNGSIIPSCLLISSNIADKISGHLLAAHFIFYNIFPGIRQLSLLFKPAQVSYVTGVSQLT